jgi:hypothetical protein
MQEEELLGPHARRRSDLDHMQEEGLAGPHARRRSYLDHMQEEELLGPHTGGRASWATCSTLRKMNFSLLQSSL